MHLETGTQKVEKLSEAKLLTELEEIRIPASDDFDRYYSDFKHDMERVDNIDQVYQGTEFGKIAEALILTQFNQGKVGEVVNVRAANRYDDYFKGVDAVLEYTHGNTPAVATVDVTVNQVDIKGSKRAKSPYAEERPVGLEEKLKRTKKYINRVAGMSAERAREVYGWMHAGGMHEARTPANAQFFKDAEEMILMKYYLSPEQGAEKRKPSYIIGGPKTVISIDTVFVNKALQGQKDALQAVQALSVVEFLYSVEAEMGYLNKKTKENQNRNVFFDTYYAKVDAWVRIFEQPVFQEVVAETLALIHKNPDIRKQLAYYKKTIDTAFSGVG